MREVPPTATASQADVGSRSVAVRLRGLRKLYGSKTALQGLDLDILRGDIFGLIGPNGAGKTTTLRILAGLLLPTEGSATVDGVDVVAASGDVKMRVGYMPDAFGVYEGLTLREYLSFFAEAFRIPSRRRRQVVAGVLELTDLGSKANDAVSSFSRGMRQRACLAKTLLHDPGVLLLDEPASGLDPRARIEFRELLRELQRMGKTIVISSHILVELSTICDSVGILEAGRLVAAGRIREILGRLRPQREFTLELLDAAELDRAVASLDGSGGVRLLETREDALRFAVEGDATAASEALRRIVSAGVRVAAFREDQVDLETAFLSLTRGELA